MIRWTYLLPRLLLLILLLLGLHFGSGPLLHWALVTAGQLASGSKIEVGGVLLDWTRGRFAMRDVQVANPQSPMRNLVQFDEAEFVVDPQSLLHRRLVVDRGAVHGIQLDTDRIESGDLGDSADTTTGGWSNEQWAEAGQEWLEGLAGRLDTRLEDELETVRLGKELGRRWPQEYAVMEDRVQAWRVRIEQLRDVIQQPPRGNVLEQAEFYQQRLAELEQMRVDLQRFRDELRRLQLQAQDDRQAMDAARRRDEQHIREKLRWEELDPANLSEYLLGEDTSRSVQQALLWLQRGQQLLDVAVKAPEVNQTGGRGTIVNLDDGPLQPDLLIRRLDLDGVFRHGGQIIPFAGSAEGLTHQPARHGKPAVVRVQTQGEAASWIECVLDCTTSVPRSKFVVQCPRLQQPSRELGKPEQLALRVAPGSANMWIEVELVGQQILGQIKWRQEDVQLTSRVGPKLGGQYLAGGLQTAVGQVRELEATVYLEGRLPRPAWRMQSNLGNQLATGMNDAVQQELSMRAEQLSAQVDQQLRRQMARLEDMLAAKQDALFQKLQIGEQQVAEFKQSLTRRVGLPQNLIGRESPLNRLFK